MGPHEFPSCHMVVIADPDGNRLTLHKSKKEASFAAEPQQPGK
jgi:hypothetical protein